MIKPKKYRKKPVIIEALQLTWDNWNEMCDFAGVGEVSEGKPQGTSKDQNGEPIPNNEIAMFIPTLEGLHLARQGDWIIRGIKGELYDDIVKKLMDFYEENSEHQSPRKEAPNAQCLD